MFRPDEIIVTKAVADELVTRRILDRCSGAHVRFADTNCPNDIKAASSVLSSATGLAERIAAGKKIMALVSTTDAIGVFTMPDPRMGCPHFRKLVLVSNGCPYHCEWCFLQGTYRDLFSFMAVRVRFDQIKKKILSFLRKPANRSKIILFNNGELQDSLALEHLTGAAETFIPFFGKLPNAYLFLLTKSENVEPILDLPHNGHTILAWSLNAAEVSQEFEIGAPSFENRLRAARQAQDAGYRVRIRLDPIVPLPGWERMYAAAIGEIFAKISPERVTIGTLRFEENFYRNRHAIIGERHPGSRLLREMERMQPMLPPMEVPTGKRTRQGTAATKIRVGKFSYPQELRAEIFRFAISEIRKHFRGPVALCKETADLWRAVGLDPHRCECVCQHDFADITTHPVGAESGNNARQTP